MQKSKTKIVMMISIVAIIFILSVAISFVVYNANSNSKNIVTENLVTDENLIIVNDVLQELTVDSEDDILMQNENEIIGTIEIPKIELNAPIREGTSQEILKQYVGHFSNSSIWDGNVCLAAHNRGSQVEPYFERVNELVNGDTIIYKTKLGEKSYQVTTIKEIEDTDWSVTEKHANEENTITLITCIANEPQKRLCVVAEEKM